MALLPPVGWADVATRQDLEQLRRELDQHMATTRHELDQHMAATLHEFEFVRRDIEQVRQDVRGFDERLDARIDARLGQFRADLLRTLGTWFFASQAILVATLSLVVALD